MNRLKVLAQYLEIRFPDSPEYYHDKWRKRFERGEEWAFSDYAGRHLLQKLDPEYYPRDIDAFFPNYNPIRKDKPCI